MKPSAAVARFLEMFTGDRRLAYVDCGARKGKIPPAFRRLKVADYIGIEADADECARLNGSARPGHRYVQAVLGRTAATATFRVTRNPASASLLEPNTPFLSQFLELRESFHVDREIPVQTMTLDECLAGHGVPRADFIELDVQGSELDILAGAARTLSGAVGVQAEVEFAPLYIHQPLFADVDAFLRQRGFQLFDLSRYHVRRVTVEAATPTRGQLLWGHALYLRDHDALDPLMSARLAVLAAMLDLPDLAEDILTRLASRAGSQEQRDAAQHAREALAAAREESPHTAASRGRAIWRD